LGFWSSTDSKALTATTREKLFHGLKSSGRIGWAVRCVSAEEISAKMLLRTPISLNAMAFDAALGLAVRLKERGLNLRKLIVDTVGDPGRYQRFLHEGLGGTAEVVVEKKADATYPVVSAASIAAKCTRDASVADDVLQASVRERAVMLKGSVGSGYPSDPKCKAWLAENLHPVFGWPSVVRFSWANAKDMLQASAVAVDFGDDDEEDEEHSGGKWGAAAAASSSSSSSSSTTAASSRISTFFTPPAVKGADGEAASVRKPSTALTQIGATTPQSLFA
jgi:ribonuclease H2 subunit A